jgi:tRNA(fMet)-specific endonuclease VapC
MIQYILDTDHVSLLRRGNTLVQQRLQYRSENTVAISVITIEEQVQGWLNEIRKASATSQFQRLCYAYWSLGDIVAYLSGFPRLNFDETACGHFVKLRQQGVRIGTQDLRIAAIALTQNLILVTCNQQDFAQVPNLQIENWST